MSIARLDCLRHDSVESLTSARNIWRLAFLSFPASGFVFAYVVSGAIRSQVEGKPLRVYSAGQSWTEPPNAHHLVGANASKTSPARLIAYIIADDGAQPTVRQVISRRPGN
jgi:hypothetical protein